MVKSTITNDIRRFRFENGQMSQAELAKRTGVTRQTILALEAQKYSPSLELAFRIAAAFDQSLENVFHYQRG